VKFRLSTMSNFEDIGKMFVQHYYSKFDANQRNELGALYQPSSMLTFEGEKFQGATNIVGKLTTLSFSTVSHQITSLDSHPTPGNGVLVFVCGNLIVDGGNETPLKFSQVFNLLPGGNGGYFVINDIFRLNYG